MEKCPRGFICFNSEIFLIVGFLIVIIAVYGFHNRDNFYFKKDSNADDISREQQVIQLKNLQTTNNTQPPRPNNQFEEQQLNQHLHLNHNHNHNQYQNQNQNQLPNINETINNYNYTNYDIRENPYSNNYPNLTHQRELANIRDPLMAPERKYPYVVREVTPINIPTRGYVSEYQQLGALYSVGPCGGKPQVLPLFGKPTYPGSHKWLYHTTTDSYNTVKVPVSKDGKKCGGDFGCNEFDGGDLVNVAPYACKFKVELYDIDQPRYIPHII